MWPDLPPIYLLTLGYQGTEESLALGLPKDRYMGTVRMMIFNNTSLALEYRYDERIVKQIPRRNLDCSRLIY